jgi:hypothetical protein
LEQRRARRTLHVEGHMCVYLSAMCGDRAAAKHRPVLFAAQKKSNALASYKRLAVADASERSAADAAYMHMYMCM